MKKGDKIRFETSNSDIYHVITQIKTTKKFTKVNLSNGEVITWYHET